MHKRVFNQPSSIPHAGIDIMKYFSLVIANLLAAHVVQGCKYCETKPDDLPFEMVETLKEIASQQQTQTDASGHVLATFLEMDFNQDRKYIASQIQATLSAVGIDSNIAPKGLYDEAFFLDLPNVSLEYISEGPFQLANLIQSGYGLLTGFPLFESSNESIGSLKKN